MDLYLIREFIKTVIWTHFEILFENIEHFF